MNSIHTFLDASFHLHGNLVVNGSCDLYGRVDGNLDCRGQVGEVQVLATGSVGGVLTSTVCDVHGVVSGGVVSRTCVVHPGGSVSGATVCEDADGVVGADIQKWKYESDDLHIAREVFELAVSPIIGDLSIGRSVLFSDELEPKRSLASDLRTRIKSFLKK